ERAEVRARDEQAIARGAERGVALAPVVLAGGPADLHLAERGVDAAHEVGGGVLDVEVAEVAGADGVAGDLARLAGVEERLAEIDGGAAIAERARNPVEVHRREP